MFEDWFLDFRGTLASGQLAVDLTQNVPADNSPIPLLYGGISL